MQENSLWGAVIGSIGKTDMIPAESLSDRLARAIQAHVNGEKESIAAYGRLMVTVDDPASRLVLSEVLADEERHHAVFARIAAQLDYENSPFNRDPALPVGPGPASPDPGVVRELRALARHERESVRRLRELARQSRHEYDGLLALLLEAVAMDSAKHERMLTFVLRRLRNGA